MTPEDFVRAYEAALATQDWTRVQPLMHPDVCVTFSSGEQHRGLAAVERAYRTNFAAIRDERYEIRDVHWVSRDPHCAVYLFHFRWSGEIDGRPASGNGTGTAMLVSDGERWRLLAEHLGPGPRRQP